MINVEPLNSATILLLGNYLPDGQRSMQRFTHLLAEGLTARGITVEVFCPPVVVGKLGAKGHGFGKWLGYVDKYLLLPFFLRRKLRSISGPCVVHICDHSNAPYTRWLSDTPHLVTCHDLLAVRSALGEIELNQVSMTGKQQQAMILRGLKRSACIASVSGATRDDVARLVGPHTRLLHVIANALDDAFIQESKKPSAVAPLPEDLLKLPEGANYLMHIGGEKWYKNRAAVLAIFSHMARTDHSLHLVIVGPRFSEERIKEHGCFGLTGRIHYLADISDSQLRALYTAAELLLFPSWLEGFGWPILEAQACGCPVATLDRAPMNELNAIPALKWDASEADSTWTETAAAQCLDYLQLDATEKQRAQAAMKTFASHYSNESAIDAYLTLYQELLTPGLES
jgi:glycosyltransferase involved in cell wall biosynthesis